MTLNPLSLHIDVPCDGPCGETGKAGSGAFADDAACCPEQEQGHGGHGGSCLGSAEEFKTATEAVIAACRGVVCWGGTAFIELDLIPMSSRMP